MATITDKIGKNLVFAGLERIIFVPWANTSGVWEKGTTGFCLDDVVADTTTVQQEDAETNAIECETRDEPIYENISLGSYTFTCDSANIDKDILEGCLGYTVEGEGESLLAYAPTSYKEQWAEIELQFKNGYSIVLPKVKLSSKLDASSLKTGIVKGTIAGTCYTTEFAEGKSAPIYISGKAVNTVGTAGV